MNRSFQQSGKLSSRGSLRSDSLFEWLAWQEKSHSTTIELGLKRCRTVARNMGLLNPSYTVISIAGTNGKGSSVEFLSLILRHAGYRVGCYTSPHLVRYNERVTVDGKEVTDEQLVFSFDQIECARGDISLTYFEFGTLAALDIFMQKRVDIAILEVGLGGRLDAVNILDADIVLITSIDLDHQQWLGPDRETIALEKAGIFRSSVPAICSDPNPPDCLISYAETLGTPLLLNGSSFTYTGTDDTWCWYGGGSVKEALPRPMQYCNHQIQNAAGVLMVLSKMNAKYPVSDEDIHYGLRNFRLKGRFQMIPGEFRTILDVAHNEQAIKTLVNDVQLIPQTGKIHILLGLLQDKDHEAIFNILSPIVDRWHLVSLKEKRGSSAEVLAQKLDDINIHGEVLCHDNIEQAINIIQTQAGPGDSVIITGSFLTVGAALKYLKV